MPSSEWHETVRQYHKRTAGLLLAQSEPCLSTRDLEASEEFVSGRTFEAVEVTELERRDLPDSWFLGVLACPEDNIEPLARWAARLDSEDIQRIRFYVHEDVDLVRLFEPWYGEGLPSPKTAPLVEGPRFHKMYGRDHGNQVVRDAERFDW